MPTITVPCNAAKPVRHVSNLVPGPATIKAHVVCPALLPAIDYLAISAVANSYPVDTNAQASVAKFVL